MRGRELPISVAAGSAPYDALKHYLEDRAKPLSAQTTSSLLLGLRAALKWPEFILGPTMKYGAMDYWAELERRELPVERIVRTVMLRDVALEVRTLALVPRARAAGAYDAAGASSDALKKAEQAAVGWDALIDAVVADGMDRRLSAEESAPTLRNESTGLPNLDPEDDEQSQDLPALERLAEDRGVRYILSKGFVLRTSAWLDQLLSNKLDGFLQWKAPSFPLFKALDAHDNLTDEVALWIWERFTITRAEDWSTTSLLQEWEARTQGTTVLKRTVLNERRVDVDRAALLALKKSNAQIRTEARPKALDPDDFVVPAAEFLQGGNYAAAADIFAGLADLSPNDGNVLNNLGFCQMPMDPAAALATLQRSSLYSRDFPLIGTANRVLALHLVGRDEDALALAQEAVLPKGEEGDMYAWEHECGKSLRLAQHVDSRKYLQDLKQHILEVRGKRT